jgi:hypothetical protein
MSSKRPIGTYLSDIALVTADNVQPLLFSLGISTCSMQSCRSLVVLRYAVKTYESSVKTLRNSIKSALILWSSNRKRPQGFSPVYRFVVLILS